MRDQHLWKVGRLRAQADMGRGRNPGGRASPAEASGNPRGQSEDRTVLQICSKLRQESPTCRPLPLLVTGHGPPHQEHSLGDSWFSAVEAALWGLTAGGRQFAGSIPSS